MAELYDEADYFGTPESRDRDARLVGHEPKGEAMTEDPKCEAGCISYYGGEKKHHRDCPYYPESLTKLNADRIEALLAERDALRAAQSYTYIGKDGKPVLARDLEDERNTLEAQVEGSLTILAQERAEVLKLREQLAKVEEVLKDALKYNTAMHGGAGAYNKRIKDTIAALKGDSHD